MTTTHKLPPTLLAATALAATLATGAAAPSDNPHSAIRNPQSGAATPRPNILLILTDQWRKQALGYRPPKMKLQIFARLNNSATDI